jgi:hypothetical protein
MTPELSAKLARIQNYRTRYEVTAKHPDGREILIGYTSRKGRQGLCELVSARTERATAIVYLCKADTYHTAKRAADGMTCGQWTIRFTGRTQRDAYMEGEREYVEDYTARPENFDDDAAAIAKASLDYAAANSTSG